MKAFKKQSSRCFLLLALFFSINADARAQEKHYAIASPELSLRQGPGTQSPVLAKIPYGSPLVPVNTNNDTDSYQQVVVGGLPGYWKKVKYKEATGYVIDAYLSGIAPPKPGTKDMSSYASQVSRPFGNKLTTGKSPTHIEEGGEVISRQLYQNGMVYTQVTGYEYMAETLQFPAAHIASVYNLLRNIDEFGPVLKTNNDLKEGEHTTKDSKGKVYTWKVMYEKENGTTWLQAIKINWEEGGYYNLEVRALETEVIVTYSSGV